MQCKIVKKCTQNSPNQPNRPNQPKHQIIFHKRSPSQDFIKKSLVVHTLVDESSIHFMHAIINMS